MKKILIIGGDSQPIPPVNGGAVENLIQMFIETNEIKKNFKINVISCHDEKIDKEERKYKYCNYKYIHNFKKLPFFRKYFSIVINKILRKDIVLKSDYINKVIKKIKTDNIDFDVVLVENYIQAILPLRKNFPDKKIIFHLHNDKLNYNTIQGKKIVKCCDTIITVSDYIKNRVNTITGATEKTFTVLNSIYVNNFGTRNSQNISHDIKNNLNISENDKVILFAGRITKSKGVYELVSAFKNIVREDLKLVIVGDSWYKKSPKKDKYIDLIKDISEDVRENIIFTGYVEYSDMPNYYAIADIVVIPSIWQEPCSLTLFETMASNKVLLTTNTGGTPEVVKNHGILINVNDNMIESLSENLEELINDRELCYTLAKDGYDYIQKYNPDRYYNKLMKIINGVDRK